MKALKLKSAVSAMAFLVAFALIDSSFSSPQSPRRLDIFDAQGNNLIFINFEYDRTGKDTAYTVYFSDSVFTRRVVIGRDASGRHEKETAYNFTDDTVFNAGFKANGDKTDISVSDQFKVDQLGGPVSYSKTGDLEYAFNNGNYPYKMKYEYDANGGLKAVNMFDGDGKLAYFGLFDSAFVGVVSPRNNRIAPIPSMSLKGDDALAWKFTLERASKVKCEAISIMGRRVAVLFSGNLPQGSHSKILGIGSAPSLTNGVYVAVMSIDDKPVARTKFIVQRVRGGVK
jgi:hypothetical protein